MVTVLAAVDSVSVAFVMLLCDGRKSSSDDDDDGEELELTLSESMTEELDE